MPLSRETGGGRGVTRRSSSEKVEGRVKRVAG
jgi:hypothetical protein